MTSGQRLPPRISDAEWEVMRILWNRRAGTAQEVVAELPHRKWSERTVKTMLNRLLAKGALKYELDGRAYVYRPAVRMEDCVRIASQSFLDRVFGGSNGALLMHFATRSHLTAGEIEELKSILERKRR